jgi:hypothetical protein
MDALSIAAPSHPSAFSFLMMSALFTVCVIHTRRQKATLLPKAGVAKRPLPLAWEGEEYGLLRQPRKAGEEGGVLFAAAF